MQHHSGVDIHTCVTSQSCWDSDRFDLGRVGIKPQRDYLSAELLFFLLNIAENSSRVLGLTEGCMPSIISLEVFVGLFSEIFKD